MVAGGLHRNGEPDNTWKSLDGQFTLVKQDTSLIINNTLTIQNFDFTTGALGIHLENAPNTATPAVREIDFTHPFPTTTVTKDEFDNEVSLNDLGQDDPFVVFTLGGDMNQVLFGGQRNEKLNRHRALKFALTQ